MPNLPGLFDSFDNLDRIQPEAISSWLKSAPQLSKLENYLANRILYPGTLPLTDTNMQIDLAILREALKKSNPFLNTTLRKILIPAKFLEYVPDLKSLVWAFVDTVVLQDVWTIVLTGSRNEIIGSVILPRFDSNRDRMDLTVMGKNYKILPGGLTIIPCPKERCPIEYFFLKGKVLGKQSNKLEIYGGKLGLVIDGRNL